MTHASSTHPEVTLLLLITAAAFSIPVSDSASLPSAPISFTRRGQFGRKKYNCHDSLALLERLRGGSSATIDEDEYDEDEYEDEYDSDVDTAEILSTSSKKKSLSPSVATAQRTASKSISTKKLAASAISATAKKSAQRTAVAKAKVNAAMSTNASQPKKKGGSWYKRTVPYIIRACLNPFTLLAMTKAYFVSLCDINYLKEEPTQNLRSALEEKARRQPGGGPSKPKRKMKPGQAKTLSDLPQLSA